MRDQGLKGQDIVVLARLWVGGVHGNPDPIKITKTLSSFEKKIWRESEPPPFLVGISQKALAEELGLSVAEMSLSAGRIQASGLVNADWSVRSAPFLHLVEWGVPYFLPPVQGPEALGVPTAWGHDVVASHLRGSAARAPVWPSDVGTVMGPSLSPLFRTVPLMAREHLRLHAALAAIDLLRLHGAREKEVALAVLAKLLA